MSVQYVPKLGSQERNSGTKIGQSSALEPLSQSFTGPLGGSQSELRPLVRTRSRRGVHTCPGPRLGSVPSPGSKGPVEEGGGTSGWILTWDRPQVGSRGRKGGGRENGEGSGMTVVEGVLSSPSFPCPTLDPAGPGVGPPRGTINPPESTSEPHWKEET